MGACVSFFEAFDAGHCWRQDITLAGLLIWFSITDLLFLLSTSQYRVSFQLVLMAMKRLIRSPVYL